MNGFDESPSKENGVTYELSRLYRRWGYKEYRMSKFEEYSFYSDNRDFLPSKSVLAFNNSDGRLIALKPDITLSIVKNAKLSDSLSKLYYNESVFRITDGSSDFKEIKQTGVEILGADDGYTICEALMLALKSLEIIDENFALITSHMAFILSILADVGANEKVKKEIVEYVKSKNAHDLRAVCLRNGIEESETDALVSLSKIKGKIQEVLPRLRELSRGPETNEACDELEFIAASFKNVSLADKLFFDMSALNDAGYYNGAVFQGYVEKAPSAALSGGRYDKLAGKIRNGLRAVGFAVYLDDLNLYYGKKREFDSDILIIFDPEEKNPALLSAADEFVNEGFSVRVESKIPEGYKAKVVYSFKNGELKEELLC